MIPKIIHQTARTDDLSWEERVLIKRNRAVLHDWRYKFWNDADLPDLVMRTFPQYAEQFSKITRGIVRSDIARYMFLYESGGLYFDTDYKLINPVDDLLDAGCILPIEEFYQGHARLKLGNAFIASVPRHVFWVDLIDKIFVEGGSMLNQGNPVMQTGPIALTELWKRNAHKYDDVTIPERPVFYPHFRMMNFSFEQLPNTRGVHLCWGGWRGKQGSEKVRNFVRRKTTCLYP